LDFTAQALRRSMDNSEEELNTSFTKAYEATLKKHHNMLIRPVFSVSFLFNLAYSIGLTRL
jgi:hypothetical protein